MGIYIKLSFDKLGLVASTDNGHEFNLPREPSECYALLLKLLATQAKPKTVPAPGRPDATLGAIADWERIGPTGAGKVRKGVRPPRQQKFDEKGNRTEHNDPIELLP